MTRCTVLVSGLCLFFVVILAVPGPAATTREAKLLPLSKLERAYLKAAQDVLRDVDLSKFEGVMRVTMPEMESNYLWSKHLQEAERKVARNKKQLVAAFKGHFDRMTKLEARIKAWEWAGTNEGRRDYMPEQRTRLAAMTYYRTEAEVSLEKAKSKR
jgi:hypothetical protein